MDNRLREVEISIGVLSTTVDSVKKDIAGLRHILWQIAILILGGIITLLVKL